MRVIVTRPAAQAADWVLQLGARGIDAVALPLIEIAPIGTSAALDAAWQTLAQQRLVVFVSPNAAVQFLARRPPSVAWPVGALAGSTGPGTTRALLAQGVPAARIVEPPADAAQFDSESLWRELGSIGWQGARVLIVRGDGGRDWLADTLRRHGALVADVAAYRRVAPAFGAAETELLRAALERPASCVWLFSSSEAIGHLAASAPAGAAWTQAQAIATHPRIAARARQLGFARVIEARPSLEAVVACIQSIGP